MRNSRAWVAIVAAALAFSVDPIAVAATPSVKQILKDAAEQQRAMMERRGSTVQAQTNETDDGVQVVLQTGHAGGIALTAMSPDGRQVLTGSHDGAVKLWDVASGRELLTFSGLNGQPSVALFSADNRLALVDDGLMLHVFDLASGHKLRTYSGGMSYGGLMAGGSVISSGGRFIANTTGDRTKASIEIVELTTGKVVWSTPPGDFKPLSLSDDGRVLIVQRTKQRGAPNVKLETETLVWDAGAARPRGPLPFLADAGDARAQRLMLSPDGRFVVLQDQAKLQLFAIDGKTPLATLEHGGSARGGFLSPMASFSADGHLFLHALLGADSPGDPVVNIWELPSGRLLHQVKAQAAAFSADGKNLVLGIERRSAPTIHELASGKNTDLSGSSGLVFGIEVLSQGRLAIATMLDSSRLSSQLWDLATGQLLRNVDCPGNAFLASVVTRPTDSLAALVCADGSVWLSDLAGSEPPRALVQPGAAGSLRAGFGPGNRAAFTPDGRKVVVAYGPTLSVRDVQDGRELHRLSLPVGHSRMIGVDPLAQIDTETLKRMPKEVIENLKAGQAQMADPKNIALAQDAANAVVALAVDREGRLVAVGRQEDISVWNLESGALVRNLSGANMTPVLPDTNAAAPDRLTELWVKSRSGARMPVREYKELQELLSARGQEWAANFENDERERKEDAEEDASRGARHLTFAPDGRLLSLDSSVPFIWDVSTGRKVRVQAHRSGSPSDPLMSRESEDIETAAFSPDGRVLALAVGADIRLQDLASGNDLGLLQGRGEVRALGFTADGHRLLSGGSDGKLNVWSLAQNQKLVELIALGSSDYVAVTPDQFYRSSKSNVRGVAFRVKGQLYPFEQFDLRFHRPDIVLQRLGLAAPEVVQSYEQAYTRRLRKMGFTASMLGKEFHLPELSIQSKDLPLSTAEASLKLHVTANDDSYALDRLNVFVNDVPIYGTAGLAVTTKGAQHAEQDIVAPLVVGRNKVQVSVLNAQGTESLKQTIYVTSTADPGPADIYVVAIGVSTYKNSAYNLRYAAKDAGDFVEAYRSVEGRPAPRGRVHVLDLTNNKATRDGIRQAKDFLKQARVNDLAVVFAAGHGMTDAKQNYYFGTWDIDPAQPEDKGLPYEDFEGLLDGITAMQKMLLLDTCFSGEINKDEPTTVAATIGGAGTVNMRAFKTQRGVSVVADVDGNAGTSQGSNSLVRFQQDWFADLRRGTGAVVISSASGNEYALEGAQWHNGVFTYALLNGLKNRAADSNKDSIVTVGELQAYVIDQVRTLTQGGQNPTVRRENLEYDFVVF